MELKQLEYFLVRSEEFHFGKAAQRIGILPATLSREVKLLENSLNARLFVRTTRNVFLTDEGEYLALEAKKLLVGADQIRLALQKNFLIIIGYYVLAQLIAQPWGLCPIY